MLITKSHYNLEESHPLQQTASSVQLFSLVTLLSIQKATVSKAQTEGGHAGGS